MGASRPEHWGEMPDIPAFLRRADISAERVRAREAAEAAVT
jgi:hypothetical protein